MSRAEEVVTAAVAAELRAENVLLRKLLWAFHGSACYPAHYGDDGELQCAGVEAFDHGPIDFKRDAAASIEKALHAPSLKFVQDHQGDVCKHCGVGRWTFDHMSRTCSAVAHEWVTPARPERTE